MYFILYWFYLNSQRPLTDKFMLYTVTDQYIVFLVSDSCRAMVRNYNGIKH